MRHFSFPTLKGGIIFLNIRVRRDATFFVSHSKGWEIIFAQLKSKVTEERFFVSRPKGWETMFLWDRIRHFSFPTLKGGRPFLLHNSKKKRTRRQFFVSQPNWWEPMLLHVSQKNIIHIYIYIYINILYTSWLFTNPKNIRRHTFCFPPWRVGNHLLHNSKKRWGNYFCVLNPRIIASSLIMVCVILILWFGGNGGLWQWFWLKYKGLCSWMLEHGSSKGHGLSTVAVSFWGLLRFGTEHLRTLSCGMLRVLWIYVGSVDLFASHRRWHCPAIVCRLYAVVVCRAYFGGAPWHSAVFVVCGLVVFGGFVWCCQALF